MAAAVGLLTLAPTARAHPDAASVWGHQIDVLVEGEVVVVEVTVEVPVLDAAALAQGWLRSHPEASQEDFNTSFREGLHQDLRVESDGAVLPTEPLAPSAITDRDPRFVVWRVRARTPWPADAEDLVVVHGAWPGEQAVYSASVWIGDEVALLSSSLLRERGGRWVSQDGQWRPDPGLREVELGLRRRTPLEAWRHQTWRWLTTPAAEWRDAAPQGEVLEGASIGLTRLLGGAAGAGLRATAAGGLLSAGSLVASGRALALLALRGREVVWMVGVAVGLSVALHLLPTADLPAWSLPGVCAGAALWAARAALRDRPVALLVGVVVGTSVLGPVADALATGPARGAGAIAGLSLFGALLSLGITGLLGGRLVAGRLSPRLRALALGIAAILQIGLVFS